MFLASIRLSRIGAELVRFPGNALVVMSSGASLALEQKASKKVIAFAVAFACLSGVYTIVTVYERSFGFDSLDIRLCRIVRMCPPPKNDPGPEDPAFVGTAPPSPPPPAAPSGSVTSVDVSKGTTIAPGPVVTSDSPVEGSTVVRPSRFVPDPDKATLRDLFRQLAMADRTLHRKYPDLAADISRIQRQPVVGPGVARCALLLSAKSSSVNLMMEEIVQGEAVSSDRDQAMLADQACADAVENALARIKERTRG